MSNMPFPPRSVSPERPPRFDRNQEIAAFHLGFEPHRLWYDFAFTSSELPDAECVQRLLDLPVHLSKYFDNYATVRLLTTYQKCLHLFSRYSARSAVEFGSEYAEEDDSDNTADSESNGGEEPTRTDGRPTTGLGLSERTAFRLLLQVSDLQPSFYDLLRLARSIGDRLPNQLQCWFRFGEVVGTTFYYLIPQLFRTEMNLAEQIRIAAAQTDFPDLIGDISLAAFESRTATEDTGFRLHMAENIGGRVPRIVQLELDLPDNLPNYELPDIMYPPVEDVPLEDSDEQFGDIYLSAGFKDWVVNRAMTISQGVENYLCDKPRITFHRQHNYLWFLGCRVELTKKESRVLDAIATAGPVASRSHILTSLQNAGSGVEEEDMHKPDRYVQFIIDKISTALKGAKSPYFRTNKTKTNDWLRKDFIVSKPGVGWGPGELMTAMVVERRDNR